MSEADADKGSDTKNTILLKVVDVARRLSVTERRVWQLISEGSLKAVRLSKRATRISEGELNRYLETLGV